MATLAREVTKGRMHLMVGTVAIRLEDSTTMAEHVAKIGAESILVGSTPYSCPDRTGKCAERPCHRPGG